MKEIKKAFTLVELVVVVTIIAILWAIWFASYSSYIEDARDSTRKTNFSEIWAWLKQYKLKKSVFVIPENYFKITNSGTTVAWQWLLWKNSWLSTLDEIPYDPKINRAYSYSIMANKKEYELAGTLENGWNPISILIWNYKSVAKNVLPTIMFATWTTSDFEINSWSTDWAQNRNLVVFNNQDHNLVYDFEWHINWISDWTSFEDLLAQAEESGNFSQNTSLFNCVEIKQAWKNIWEWEYQIRTSTWWITNTWCLDASNY